jgi:hypothetical protein
LVILPGSEDQGTYWAMSEFTTLDDARRNLSQREGTRIVDIDYILKEERRQDEASGEGAHRVRAWLADRQDVGAAVWTGLSSNWTEKRGAEFTANDAIRYVKELEGDSHHDRAEIERARHYIVNAPPLINTEVREILRARGWRDTELPATLFERSQSAL